MIKHEFGNQNKVRIFFNISVGFLPFLYFTKLPFSGLLSQFCFIFQTFGKLFFEWGRFNQFPFLMLTNIDNVDRAPQNCCMSSVLNFLGLPNFIILILPEKVRKMWDSDSYVLTTLSLILFPPWIIPYYSVFLYQVYIQQEPFSFSGRTIVLFRGRIPQKFS